MGSGVKTLLEEFQVDVLVPDLESLDLAHRNMTLLIVLALHQFVLSVRGDEVEDLAVKTLKAATKLDLKATNPRELAEHVACVMVLGALEKGTYRMGDPLALGLSLARSAERTAEDVQQDQLDLLFLASELVGV